MFISKANYLKYFSHPAFIALIMSLIIIILLPPIFVKFQAQLIKERLLQGNNRIYYCDLKNDGTSERIHLANNNQSGIPIIIVYENDGSFICDWTLPDPWILRSDLYFTDFNNDGLKEIIVFTRKADSVFINGYTICPKHKLLFRKYVDRIFEYQGVYDSEIWNGKAIDINNDGIKELYFVLNSGYSQQPRNVYIYFPDADSIKKSPKSGLSIVKTPVFVDINNDNKDEILLTSYASGNIRDSLFPYHDMSAWLVALNLNLDFTFDPIEFKNYTTGVDPVPVRFKGETYITFQNRKVDKSGDKISCIYLVNSNGEFSARREIKSDIEYHLTAIETKKGDKLYQVWRNGEFYELNNKLKVINKHKPLRIDGRVLQTIDIDNDGLNEIILVSENLQQLYILRNGLNHPVTLNIPNRRGRITLSIKKNKEPPSDISIQVGQFQYLYAYDKNPLYVFRWLVYILIWLILFMFIAGLKKLYQHQIYKKHKTEQRIAELQIQSVTNQMTPHFMFNVLNVVSNNIILKKQEEANTYLIKFSRLLKSLYSSTKELTVTLQGELDFVKNYLDLQKIRFADKINYIIQIDEHINTNVHIPRMLIQLFVENSIKHGLAKKEGKGIIKIIINREDENLLISIEDNGIGREEANKHKERSGAGMVIIDEMILLNYNLNKQRITYRYEDLFSSNNKSLGTKVWITVYK